MRRLTHNNQAVNQLNNFAPTQGGGVTPAGEIINAITSKEAAPVHEALVARGLETPLRPPVHEMDNETRKALLLVI